LTSQAGCFFAEFAGKTEKVQSGRVIKLREKLKSGRLIDGIDDIFVLKNK